MNGWSERERRWRDALLTAMIPASALDSDRPGLGEVDTEPFWSDMEQAAPPLLRLGLRFAVWVLTWAPLLLIGRARSFRRLAGPEQDRVLERAASSRFYLLRQLVMMLKAFACFAYFRAPNARRRFAPNDEVEPAAPLQAEANPR